MPHRAVAIAARRGPVLVAALVTLATFVTLLPAQPASPLEVDGGSVAVGARAAATEFYFAEGATREGFQEYVSVLNPGDTTANASLTWDLADAVTGTRSRRSDPLTVPPGRTTVDVNRAVGAGLDARVPVESDRPVV